MCMCLRPRKSSGDSIDNMSWSFDSIERTTIITHFTLQTSY